MTIRSTQQIIGESNEVLSYAGVFLESSKQSNCVPEKKRITMIAREMDAILEDAQDYLLRHMLDDEIGDEAKNSLFKAAMKLTYLKHYYDVTESKVVYYPTCQELILSHELIDEAEKHFYMDKDKFPPEYRRALRSVVRAAEKIREIRKNQAIYEDEESLGDPSEYDDINQLLSHSMHVRNDLETVEKFAGSWRNHISFDDLSIGDDDEFSSLSADE